MELVLREVCRSSSLIYIYVNFPFMTKSEKKHDLNDGNKKNRITDTGTFPVPQASN